MNKKISPAQLAADHQFAQIIETGEPNTTLRREFGLLGFYFEPIPDKKQHAWLHVDNNTVWHLRSLNPLTKKRKTVFNDKQKTRKILADHGYSISKGAHFDAGEKNKAVDWYLENKPEKVVVKPNNLYQGIGVTTGIENLERFKKALSYISDEDKFIVEDHADGNDHRAMVVNGKLAAVTIRIPASIIGDGESSVQELIDKKNIQRATIKRLQEKLIKVTDQTTEILQQQGLTLESIPPSGSRVTLVGTANVTTGGDNMDVSESVHPNFISLFQDIFLNISNGRLFLAIDIICTDISKDPSEVGYTILEINSGPALKHNSAPSLGRGRNTERLLARAFVEKYNIKPKFTSISILVKGTVQDVGFRKWCAKQAISLGISCNAEYLENPKKVRLSLEGGEQSLVEFKRRLLGSESPARIEEISLSKKKPASD